MVALSLSTEISVMPPKLCPTFTVLGAPELIDRIAALVSKVPISETSAAATARLASRRRSAIECRIMTKPVAIFRHARSEGPGYFATYLERRAIPWKLLRLDE